MVMPGLGLSRSMEGTADRPRGGGPHAAATTGGNGEGGGTVTFWKVVATVATLLLCWIGTQLIVVPTHTVQIQRLEASDQHMNGRLEEVERAQAAEKSGRDELIKLLKDEQAARQKRRR